MPYIFWQSYTYGPILGLFAFGIFMKQQVQDKYIPLVAILSLLCFILQRTLEAHGSTVYQFGYGLPIFNALFTFIGSSFLIKKDKRTFNPYIIIAVFRRWVVQHACHAALIPKRAVQISTETREMGKKFLDCHCTKISIGTHHR